MLSSPCACGRLRRASRALTQLYDDVMAPSGLRVTQYSLLRALARDGTSRVTDLADKLLLDRTALSRTLEPLIERGWVSVVAGRDARTREVSLTPAGTRAVHAAEPHWRNAQSRVTRKLGAAKLQRLIATLGEIEAFHPSSGGKSR